MTDKSVLFINASTAKYSGGLVVSIDFISHLLESDAYQVVLCAPSIPAYRQFSKRLKFIPVPEMYFKYPLRWILDYFWIPKRIRNTRTSYVFSLTNLPAITRRKQFMLHDNPYLTHSFSNLGMPLPERWIHHLRNALFFMRMNYVNIYWTQTDYERKLLQKRLPASKDIRVLPPFIPGHLRLSDLQKQKPKTPDSIFKILCPARYYPHKNLDNIIALAQEAARQKLPLQFILTLDTKRNDIPSEIIKAINDKAIPLVNIGTIPPDIFPRHIAASDAIIVPSVFETFGLSCIDAWYGQKPLFIADTHWAHQICTGAAAYLSGKTVAGDLGIILSTLQNQQLIQTMLAAGVNKLTDLCTKHRFEIFLRELMDEQP